MTTGGRQSAGQNPALEAELAAVQARLGEGDFRHAADMGEALRTAWPDTPAVLRLYGQALEGLGDYAGALQAAHDAVALRPRNVRARLRFARCLWRNGEVTQALAEADLVARTAEGRVGALLRVAAFFDEVGRQDAAYRCRLRAQTAAPEDPRVLAAVAESAAARGAADRAEALYDRALFHDPEQLLLLERRGRLRRSSEADHKANQLGFTLDRLEPDDPRRAPVCFALAQELEDLGHVEPAYGIWTEGGRCRRLALDEHPEHDQTLMELVETVFDADWLGRIADTDRGKNTVFVTGLPCSGLEPVAALLRGLPGAAVLRDPGFFPDAVTRLVGPVDSREERLRAAATLDPKSMAQAFEHAARQAMNGRTPVIDVSSAHLWLLGLIRAAFPAATIVHCRRDPQDHCLELFTTLFPRGHAWSYVLEDLARHYASCHRLMGHWRRHLPGGFLDLDYEELVGDPAAVTERLAEVCGVTAANFSDPVAAITDTVGVRGPGVGRWRRFERQLAPLVKRLRLDGVPVH